MLVTPPERQKIENNWMTNQDPGFADGDRLDFLLKPDAEVFRKIPGFQAIPFDRIGLYSDEFRKVAGKSARVDARPEIADMPEVSRPGERVEMEMILHLVNPSGRQVSGSMSLWTTHKNVIKFKGSNKLPYFLGPNEVEKVGVPFRLTVRPDVAAAVGARVDGSGFSLPVPVRVRYKVAIHQTKSVPGACPELEMLKESRRLPFLRDGEAVGKLRMELSGDDVVIHSSFTDRNPVHESAPGGSWSGSYLGLMFAPHDAESTGDVKQCIFFPHGGEESGTTWFFDGHSQVEPDPRIRCRWNRKDGGWDISAILPLDVLGLSAGKNLFRFEAMANLTLEQGGKPVLVTLFGSKPARLEIETLATMELEKS